MFVAPASPRAGTQRMTPRRMIASRIGMLWMLITPKAARTPAASRNAAMTSPAITRSDIVTETTRNFYDRTGHEAAQRGSKKSDGGRDLFGAADPAERNAALLREFDDVGLALDRIAGGAVRGKARFPLARIDYAEQNRVDPDCGREFERHRLGEVEGAAARGAGRDQALFGLLRKQRRN